MQLQAGRRIAVLVNGEATETTARTLAELVTEHGFSEGAVATARNGDFVARQSRAASVLTPGDHIEIVAPRQGG